MVHSSFADSSHTLKNAIAYESPEVTSVAPKNSPMYGGFFVTLLGRHFGHVDSTVRHATPYPFPFNATPIHLTSLQHQSRWLVLRSKHVVQRQQHSVQGAPRSSVSCLVALVTLSSCGLARAAAKKLRSTRFTRLTCSSSHRCTVVPLQSDLKMSCFHTPTGGY